MNQIGIEREELFNRIVDGLASPEDERSLGKLLQASPEARQAYREFMALHAALHWDYVATALPEPPTQQTSPPLSAADSRPGLLAAFMVGMIVAALIVFAVMQPFLSKDADQPSPRPKDESRVVAGGTASQHDGDRSKKARPEDAQGVEPHTPDALVALLVDGVGARFAEPLAPDGVRFGPGEYELLAGIIHLRFAQGADMIVTSPARFEVEDVQRIRLTYGKIRVTAPPAAKGFTVATRDAAYVDLGTEFGLRVDAQSHASDLYVFDGQVNVADPQSGKVLLEVGEDESSRYIDGAIAVAPELKANEFSTAGTIGLQRWQRYVEQIQESQGLLAFYPFHKAADETALTNRKAGGAAGTITGARWVSGRWSGKEALLFDRNTDFAEIEIPGEYDTLTIAAWINVDRLDFELNAILNSDGYDVGEFHFQLTRRGLPRGGVIVEGSFQDQVAGNAVPLGQWTHVAMVMSNDARTTRIYINGVLSRERRHPRAGVLRPGLCRIGNWLPSATSSMANRALRGRMDELAIWNRALPETEIQKLVEAGRPSLLWNVD